MTNDFNNLQDQQIHDNLQRFINCMNKNMEGNISVDEKGNRWRFHDGRWWGMCKVDLIPTKAKASEMYKQQREATLKTSREVDKGIASFLLKLPLEISYEAWRHLHQVKGDYE